MATNLALEHPDYPSVLNLLAQYQMVLEQNQNAEKTLRHSLELDDKNPETLLALGTLNRLSNSHEIAQTYLKKAIELNPGIIEAYLELGQSLQDQRLDDQALQIYNKAIEQVSKDPRPYVYAANAYKASRDFRSAELMLQQAAQLAPSDQSIRRQLSAVVAQNLLDNLQEAPKRK
jgi:tetratricopeptide (TPR) repeat protein